MARLDRAICLATRSHAGQEDKGGQPYILHPLRVMLACRADTERVVAVLHDVVEHTGILLCDISEQFGPEVAAAVDALTRRKGETYEAFVTRCAKNPIACVVKLADIADNMDVNRLGREPTVQDAKRLERYSAARAVLMAAL